MKKFTFESTSNKKLRKKNISSCKRYNSYWTLNTYFPGKLIFRKRFNKLLSPVKEAALSLDAEYFLIMKQLR